MSSKEINFLKRKAAYINGALSNVKVTSFNVVSALIWRCKALSSRNNDKNRVTSVYNAVDFRSRLNLPREYCGNAILGSYVSAKCEEIEKMPFWEMVKMVKEGLDGVTDEYVKSSIDWMEINKGMPLPDIIVTSWMRLGFDRVVFPWGKPICCVPLVNQMENVCWMFPDADDEGGINILVQGNAEEMERFQFNFLNIFENGV
ncbi:hypothetical protein CASFOL_027063 [Castilleja foliolosa]|uniref:Uncharacterized protein n=1 Tax=Castilleja foliolosa TaxID=1961234 RepID=A0ABD3CIV4_9LAMI